MPFTWDKIARVESDEDEIETLTQEENTITPNEWLERISKLQNVAPATLTDLNKVLGEDN